MHRTIRVLSLLLLVVCFATRIGPSNAADDPEGRLKPGHCPCSGGKACWHYLRSPLRPPEDPCRCGVCAVKGDCSTKDRPEGWGAQCMGSQKPECFWKRHAASWGITCSACAADTECTSCDDLPGAPDAATKAQLEKQLTIEAGAGASKKNDADAARKRMLVGWSPHFYVASDVQQLKLLTQGGAPRVADAHEILHLTLERAEKAYDDFVAVWGDEGGAGGRMGIFLAERGQKRAAWQATYFGNAKTHMLYGGGPGKVAGGFCVNGFAASMDEQGNDRDLHPYIRHMIGHILYSCWHKVAPDLKKCPRWAFAGVADWLCKLEPLFVDWTTFCFDEANGPTGSGKDWSARRA